MQLLVLTLCLLGHALSLPMTTMMPDDDGHDHTKPCCLPKRWQTVLLDLKADSGLKYATVFAYDADLKKEGSITVRVEDESPIYQTFTDYNTMTTYSVAMYGDPSTHKCVQTKSSHDFYDHCFMGNSSSMVTMTPKFIADATLGLSSGGIPFHAWSLKLDMMDITIALSVDGCVPLVESVVGMTNGQMVNSLLLFNDFSTNVTTPSLLSMPPACATTT